jgi:hypothetical protein
MIDFMLGLDAPGAQELRAQAAVARVIGQCPCGCPTVELAVNAEAAPMADSCEEAIFSKAKAPAPTPEPFHIVLYVENGWLRELEFVPLSTSIPSVFPHPSALSAPVGPQEALGPEGPPPEM